MIPASLQSFMSHLRCSIPQWNREIPCLHAAKAARLSAKIFASLGKISRYASSHCANKFLILRMFVWYHHDKCLSSKLIKELRFALSVNWWSSASCAQWHAQWQKAAEDKSDLIASASGITWVELVIIIKPAPQLFNPAQEASENIVNLCGREWIIYCQNTSWL